MPTKAGLHPVGSVQLVEESFFVLSEPNFAGFVFSVGDIIFLLIMVRKCTNLKSLTINQFFYKTSITIEEISEPNKVKYLTLGHRISITEADLIETFSNGKLKCLEYLSVTGTSILNDNVIEVTVKNCPNLQQMSLN